MAGTSNELERIQSVMRENEQKLRDLGRQVMGKKPDLAKAEKEVGLYQNDLKKAQDGLTHAKIDLENRQRESKEWEEKKREIAELESKIANNRAELERAASNIK